MTPSDAYKKAIKLRDESDAEWKAYAEEEARRNGCFEDDVCPHENYCERRTMDRYELYYLVKNGMNDRFPNMLGEPLIVEKSMIEYVPEGYSFITIAEYEAKFEA